MADLRELLDFLNDLPNQVRLAQNQLSNRSVTVTEYWLRSLGDFASLVNIFQRELDFQSSQHQGTRLTEIFREILLLIQDLRRRYLENYDNNNTVGPFPTLSCADENGETFGRPRKLLIKEEIERLWSIFHSWDKVARILGVSVKTLRRRRLEFGMNVAQSDGSRNYYSTISKEQVCCAVREILSSLPNAGETYVIGGLRSRGIFLQRSRIRDAIQQVDPISRALRRTVRVIRRTYNVKAPNSLWHIDGHHNLIRLRFVIHAEIDGCSRLVTYIRCSVNNKAETVFNLFLEAINKHGLPSRVRSDFGTENVDVAWFMLNCPARGPNRGSMITGSSIHNQRIERLWGEVRRTTLQYFKDIFYRLEHENSLDPLNEIHLFSLHFVYLTRINRSLKEFEDYWSFHPLSSSNNMPPRQLWLLGTLNATVADPRHPSDLEIDSWLDYGIDDDSPVPDVTINNDVNISSCRFTLCPNHSHELRSTVDTIEEDNNSGMSVYVRVVNLVETFYENRCCNVNDA